MILSSSLRLTQIELVAKAGVGLRFVRELEQGKISIHLDKVNQTFSNWSSDKKER